jgi:hypothetical protein
MSVWTEQMNELLGRIKARLPELVAWLAEAERAEENGVYRFYQ